MSWRHASPRLEGPAASSCSVRSISGCVALNNWNAATHKNPSAPVATKAIRQVLRTVINATSGGAIIAPRLEPLLQTPMASVRASGGTQVATALANAGHAAPSPTASRLRKKPRLSGPRANAVSIPAPDHHAMARLSPRLTPRRSSTQPANEYEIAYVTRNAFTIAA